MWLEVWIVLRLGRIEGNKRPKPALIIYYLSFMASIFTEVANYILPNPSQPFFPRFKCFSQPKNITKLQPPSSPTRLSSEHQTLLNILKTVANDNWFWRRNIFAFRQSSG
jgi:hypothetical protein